jgi:hypothetical protein
MIFAFGTKLTKLGKYCLADCKSLEMIVLPRNIGRISSNVFEGCDNLQIFTYRKMDFLILSDIIPETDKKCVVYVHEKMFLSHEIQILMISRHILEYIRETNQPFITSLTNIPQDAGIFNQIVDLFIKQIVIKLKDHYDFYYQLSQIICNEQFNPEKMCCII